MFSSPIRVLSVYVSFKYKAMLGATLHLLLKTHVLLIKSAFPIFTICTLSELRFLHIAPLQDTPKGEVGCICLHCEGQVRLVVPEDGGRGEGLLEGAEGCCCLVWPGKPH